jgi:hypothetical protein
MFEYIGIVRHNKPTTFVLLVLNEADTFESSSIQIDKNTGKSVDTQNIDVMPRVTKRGNSHV